MIRYFLFVALSVLVTFSCRQKWSEEQKVQFAKECEEGRTLSKLDFFFHGFSQQQMDSIRVMQVCPNTTDTVTFHLSTAISSDGGYDAALEKSADKNCFYIVVIDSVTVYTISNLKSKMHPTFAMFEENYDCRLAQYELNGVMKEDSRIEIVK